jgi:hypothetical protein
MNIHCLGLESPRVFLQDINIHWLGIESLRGILPRYKHSLPTIVVYRKTEGYFNKIQTFTGWV